MLQQAADIHWQFTRRYSGLGRAMKPVLLCIDARRLSVNRYYPKPTGGHLIERTQIEPATDVSRLGDPEYRAAIEDFRKGKPHASA